MLTRRDFAILHDRGYQGMYSGEIDNDIHERKGLAPREKNLDWVGSEKLAANWFRITRTEAKLGRDTAVKRRLADVEGVSEVYAKCVQLKMEAADGKHRLTDAAFRTGRQDD